MSRLLSTTLTALALTLLPAAAAQEPDLWDDTQLRTFDLTFHQADWWQQLKNNKNTGIYIPADLEVDGVTYLDVGVRFRGKSSFSTNNKKKPFKIKMDAFVPGQNLYGWDSLRLNNGWADPSWIRETAMSRLLRDYMPMPKMVYIELAMNDVGWGPYVLLQQKDAQWMDQYFEEDWGNRYRSVLGHGFKWEGGNPGSYDAWYDLMNPPGDQPWQDLIGLCDVVNNFTPVGPDLTAALQPLLEVDGLLWFLAGDNAFGNNDSYAGNSNNWYLVHEMRHGRMAVVNHDLGLSFGTWDSFGPTFPINHGFNNSSRPLAHRLMQDDELKKEYHAHLRTLAEEALRWDVVGPLVQRYRDLIDDAVKNDPKAIYTYQQFLDNLDLSIPAGFWVADAVRPYVQDRHDFLIANPKLSQPQVQVDLLRSVPAKPRPTEAAAVQARVVGTEAPAELELRWRVVGPFQPVAMRDDGLSGDLAAGDGVFGALLPPQPPGARVDYYVVGTGVTKGAKSFFPAKGEFAPRSFVVRFGGEGLRITEYMYTGADGEFVELTNTSAAPIDLAGWSLDDQSADPGTFDLSAAGVLPPGQSVVVTEADAATFAAAWGLAPGVPVLGDNTLAKLGRNDALHVFDAAGVVQDRLAYGDEEFEGSARAAGEAAWACDAALGADAPYRWQLAVAGDAQGSWTSAGGDVGSPGAFALDACPDLGALFCASNPNSTGQVATLAASGSAVIADNELVLRATSVPSNQVGYFLMSSAQDQVPNFGGSQGVLCLGPPIARFSQDVLASGGTNEMVFAPDLDLLPNDLAVQPGETWSFQLWFRDANPGQTSNTSDGLELTLR